MVCSSSIPGAWPILSFLKALRKKVWLGWPRRNDSPVQWQIQGRGGPSLIKGSGWPPPPPPPRSGSGTAVSPNISINRVDIPFTCSQCRSLRPGLQIICKSGMWTLNLSILLLTLSATLLGPGASPKVLVSFNTVLYMLPISSSTSSELMSVNGPFESKQK